MPESAYPEGYRHTVLTLGIPDVMNHYYLCPKDLEGLARRLRDIPQETSPGYYYEYLEKQVLDRAWQRYGGPDGLWELLKKKRNAVINDSVKLYAFDVSAPPDYRRGGFYDITKDFFTPPRGHPYYRLPARLKSVYDRLGPRRYAACVEVLQYTDWPACPDDSSSIVDTEAGEAAVTAPAAIWVTQRPEAYAALADAVHFFAAYPVRLDTPLKSTSRRTTRAIDEVRVVLKQAPTAPSRATPEWGSQVEKLDFVDEPTLGHYEWNTEYRERVFASLCALIERDSSTWEAIRWETYDKYLSSVSLPTVLRYDATQLLWFDAGATAWLAAQLSRDDLWQGLRGKCHASGERYNDLLGDHVSV